MLSPQAPLEASAVSFGSITSTYAKSQDLPLWGLGGGGVEGFGGFGFWGVFGLGFGGFRDLGVGVKGSRDGG